MVRRLLLRLLSSYCDIHCRNMGRALCRYRISLHGDRPVCSSVHSCIQIRTMGPLSCFRRDSGPTCRLGWYQAFKAAILFSISEVKQTPISRCSDPRKCHILPWVRILLSLLEYLTISCSPLLTFVLLLKQHASLEIQWLGDALLFGAPISIAAGCRLILSLREVASHRLISGSNPVTISAFAVQDEP